MKVQITMHDYLEDIILEAPSDMDGENVRPAINNLLHANPDYEKLDQLTSELFHRLVARFLYAAKRARTDIQVAVAFLCTRVSFPN